MIYYENYDKDYLNGRILSLSRLIVDNCLASLNVELSSICNLKCSFCPSHYKNMNIKRKKKKGLMNRDLFTRIITDNSIALPIKKLILHKDGESLLNRNIEDYITLAKSRCFADIITLTTNGILLTPRKLKQLEDSGLDTITISMDAASDARYFRLKGSREYPRLEENIFDILSKRWKLKSINIAFINLRGKGNSDRELFLRKFGIYAEKSDKINIIFTNYHSWSGQVDKMKADIHLPCDYPWYGMSINYDGSVSVCCVDWNSDLVIGNLRNQNLGEIWNGICMKKIRDIHVSGNLDRLPICKKCTYKPYTYRKKVGQWIVDNIAKYDG